MNIDRIISAVCSICVCSVLSSNVSARTWDSLYAFGDSYTDSGAGYVDGNGPTAVAYLAASLNIPFTYVGDPHSRGKSLNFAVSGAQTGKSDGIRVRPATAQCGVNEVLLDRGMQTQVLDFSKRVEARSLRFNPEKTLFFFAGGLNDHDLPTATSIANLEGEVRQIYDVGGRYILVALLPTKIPAFTDVGTRLNPALSEIPANLRASLPGLHIELSKWGEFFDNIMERPGEHGIANTTDRCAGRAAFGEDPTPCPTPDTYFYFHDGHPSRTVHRLVAEELEREVTTAFP